MFFLCMKGLIIGLAIAAPVGPIGILCIQRSLHDGFKVGFMTGLGAAFADGAYGLLAGFGLTALSTFLISHQFPIRLIGGIFLLYLGIKFLLKSVQEKTAAHSDRSPLHAFGTSFLLTFTNPATILSFIAVFSSLGLNQTSSDYAHALILVFGITLGSAIWWFLLSSVIACILHHRLSQKALRNINRVSGILILSFGIFALSMK